jgi:site-specific DNA-cytosine methylase
MTPDVGAPFFIGAKPYVFKDVHFFGGSGGGGIGFSRGHARIGHTTARFESMGSIDVDPIACRDFEQNVGAPAHAVDLFTVDQFMRFHSACKRKCRICRGTRKPPPGWKELTSSDLRQMFLHAFPDVVFFSPPCKGFSALLNPRTAAGVKYQALNELVTRALFLAMEAWADDPPSLIIMENVPRIRIRGVNLLEQVYALLRSYGYAVRDLDHNCGEIGNLAQNRQRFLMVARHKEKVPPFLYQPYKKRVRGVGEAIGTLPIPGFGQGGKMHNLPKLQWITWLRLALIRSGKDWRDLHKLELDGEYLKDIGIAPMANWHRGVMGVKDWEDPSVAVTGRSGVTTGAYSVADPRDPGKWGGQSKYKVTEFDKPVGTVIAQGTTGSGAFAISDPRTPDYGSFVSLGVLPLDKPVGTVTSQAAHGSGIFSVPDPRLNCDVDDRHSRRFNNVYRIVRFDQPVQAVTSGSTPSSGGQAIADPRPAWSMGKENYKSGGHYGLIPWNGAAGTISAHAKIDRGRFGVADPRRLPGARENCRPLIISLDNTWHRPLTLLELAILQGYPLDAVFNGATAVVREHVGNSVPPPAAQAIANRMLETLLLAALEETCSISDQDIWVAPDPLPMVIGFADPDEVKRSPGSTP